MIKIIRRHNRDDKKTVLKFNIKHDIYSKGNVNKRYPHAGGNVTLFLQPSQMSIEEFYNEQNVGVEYTINQDGSASVPRPNVNG
ncbi:hypothetical protein [Peribacillus simplex]|uniref:hypothetical protein n=1 Tax=Peribacillus simplex TaxID=1478 RepID=UPI003D2CB633